MSGSLRHSIVPQNLLSVGWRHGAPFQAEGEALARKNGELEATVRKLRAAVRQLETERDRTAGRLAALEASLASEQERAVQATQAAAVQVGQDLTIFAH